jgi:hypothetical protein
MQRNDRAKLALSLEAQGGRVRSTKAGYIALNPSTRMSLSWHSSPTSDGSRGVKNLRADVVRAGFSWPFDPQLKVRKAA